MLNKIRQLLRSNVALRKFVGYNIASLGIFDGYFKNYALSDFWVRRVSDVMSSDDIKYIPTVENAGIIKGGQQTMHNGLKIYNGSYYGPEYAAMLQTTKGIHEPQEERVFQEVLKGLPQNAVMIEMGAFWSFYSMWFKQKLNEATNYMIEPDAFNLGQGKRNFKLNNFTGDFTQAFISKQSAGGEVPTICIDDFVAQKNISFIDMLHSDIQGFEYEMLQGAAKTFEANKIGYVFISTHNNEVHQQCLNFLQQRNFIIIASANMQETFSEDGLIAARASYYNGIEPINISKKK
jgi:Methyltransferase FkbM domain